MDVLAEEREFALGNFEGDEDQPEYCPLLLLCRLTSAAHEGVESELDGEHDAQGELSESCDAKHV